MPDTPSIDPSSGIAAFLASKKRRFPQHVNRISQLDERCLRRLYYARHDWDKAADTDDGLQGVFETGTILEPMIESIVLQVGMMNTPPWRIVGTQTPTKDDLLARYKISGTIDGFLQVQGPDGRWVTAGVVDIKTMATVIFRTVNSYADLGRYPWTRAYRGQLMLYALAHNMENCFILAVNKGNLFDLKFIAFPMDMEYCEGLLHKAEQVNDAVESETPPDGINDPDACPRCPWFSFCVPDLVPTSGVKIMADGELEAVLERLESLEPARIMLSDLEAERDAALVKGQDMIVGPYMVTWKKVTQNRGGKLVDSWRKSITRKQEGR